MHYIDGHYVTSHQDASTGTITIYDSLFNQNRMQSMETQQRAVYASLNGRIFSNVQYIVPQSQRNSSDCGAFAIANAFLLLSKIPPQSIYLQQSQLRNHILQSLRAQSFALFPATSKCAEYHLQYMQMQRKDPTFQANENANRNIARRKNRKDESYRANENAKRNITRGTKRGDTNYRASENNKRNVTRGIQRGDTNYRASENDKRNMTRGTKRKNSDYKTEENSKRKRCRTEKRRNDSYKTPENKRRKATRKQSALMSKLKKQSRMSSSTHTFSFTLPVIQQLMYNLCKKGDEYICTSCSQTFYQHSVYLVSKENYTKRDVPQDILRNCLTGTLSACSSEWICKTCHKYWLQKKIPPMSKHNGFKFPEYPDIIQRSKPTPTEERCCSLRIPFMQIKELGIGKQYGIFGNTVNVPMNPAEVVTAVPRRLNETATIQLQFMRKTCYKRPYLHETIRPKVIYDITKHFIETSEIYKEEKVKLNEDWLSDFNNSDEVNYITSNANLNQESSQHTSVPQNETLQDMQATQETTFNSEQCRQPTLDTLDCLLSDQPTQELTSNTNQVKNLTGECSSYIEQFNQQTQECMSNTELYNQSTQECTSDSELYNQSTQENTCDIEQYDHSTQEISLNNTQYTNQTSQKISTIETDNHAQTHTESNSDDDWEEIPEEDRVAGNCDTLLNHNDFFDDGKHALKIAPGEQSHPVSLF